MAVVPVAGASEPSAVQPAQVSGEVPGPAPRLGELAYATGEWAQWRHHQGYKELLQLLAEWESLKLPTRREVPGSELRTRFLAARELQLARPSSRTPVGAERAAELQRVAQAVLAELGQAKGTRVLRLLGVVLQVSRRKAAAKDVAGVVSRRLVGLMAEAEAQQCDTRPYPRTSPKTVVLFWCTQEATRAKEAAVEVLSLLCSNVCDVGATIAQRGGIVPLVEEGVENSGKMQCLKCFMTFSHLSSAKRHYRNRHLNSEKAICKFCKRILKNKESLDEHVRTIHGISKKQLKNRIVPNL